MKTLKKQLKQPLLLLLFGTVLSAFNPAIAETDHAAQESFLKARAKDTLGDHANHENHTDPAQVFHGIYFGFVPCNDCLGIKTSLSLNQNQNYTLMLQYARPGSRETYEKGKYNWDAEKQIVTLTPRKGKGVPRSYHIEDDNTLIQLNEEGARMTGSDADRYALHRSDTVKNREFHFH